MAHRRDAALLELNALERAAALDEVFGRIDVRAVLRHERDLLDVKARLGHRVAGLGPHGGKRPEALDAGMDEICFTDHVEPLTWGSNELRPFSNDTA